ncbi:BgTH12-05889 [Blumeria graminis f. sp. triticale]|uniref:BgTH12-05889 n=1 Tax=Blumeria graminis f. sp. triticale TaxID=1689686 RepID=A0A9W4D4X9_BLUGR|nr:BgTH12-05889 [Blumeria graminis f. sp. triticale]
MNESLNVIALISGGKDSFYSLMHCIENGHRIVALANLHPPQTQPDGKEESPSDMNSFMYQTVGHTVIPLYGEALGIPLYRWPISGIAVDTGTTYGITGTHNETHITQPNQDSVVDETESLVPLLKWVMGENPSANALCTGAILSTYQRTRVEAISNRLGLIPLSYLWQYPNLPPGTQISLLEDMKSVGLDARIVKVAGGELDESYLWQSLTTDHVIKRVEKATQKFGTQDDGSLLGEGGEYETLVIDGPLHIFKGRIDIKETSRHIITETGGTAWLHISDAKVIMKTDPYLAIKPVRIPPQFDPKFSSVIKALQSPRPQTDVLSSQERNQKTPTEPLHVLNGDNLSTFMVQWTMKVSDSRPIADSTLELIEKFKLKLKDEGLKPGNIVSSIAILRSMQDFAVINSIYEELFTEPNPPTRVTIACGPSMGAYTNLIIHFTGLRPSTDLVTTSRKALHVQSRSYWAPANIGPYSQAVITTTAVNEEEIQSVSTAGQIPLVPHLMKLSNTSLLPPAVFEAALSLQHLWRIGIATSVGWWTGVITYLVCDLGHACDISQRAILAGEAWAHLHQARPEDVNEETADEEVADLWEVNYHAGWRGRGTARCSHNLPDWTLLEEPMGESARFRNVVPPLFAVEVAALPRQCLIEWHALLGVVPSGRPLAPRRLVLQHSVIYQLRLSTQHQQVIIAVAFPSNLTQISSYVYEAFSHLGWTAAHAHIGGLTYCDAHLSEDEPVWWRACGTIPCHSLWSATGERLGVVIIRNTMISNVSG